MNIELVLKDGRNRQTVTTSSILGRQHDDYVWSINYQYIQCLSPCVFLFSFCFSPLSERYSGQVATDVIVDKAR